MSQDESQDESGIDSARKMKEVLKKNMKQQVLSIRKEPSYIKSLLRITAYKDHNKLIKDEFKERIQILDTKYGSYAWMMDLVQMSIILFAAVSSFLQAGNDIINLNNKTISFISLIISSYTGLVLALAKYKKIDEKKEAINNLRHQCAEFLTQVQTRNDRLNTWCYDKMWAGGNVDKMVNNWKTEDEQLYNELKPLIEKKQNLTCEFERILDSLTVKKTSKSVRARNLKYKKMSIEFTKEEDELEQQKNKLESKRKEKIHNDFYNTDDTDNDSYNDPTIPSRPEIKAKMVTAPGVPKYFNKMDEWLNKIDKKFEELLNGTIHISHTPGKMENLQYSRDDDECNGSGSDNEVSIEDENVAIEIIDKPFSDPTIPNRVVLDTEAEEEKPLMAVIETNQEEQEEQEEKKSDEETETDIQFDGSGNQIKGDENV